MVVLPGIFRPEPVAHLPLNLFGDGFDALETSSTGSSPLKYRRMPGLVSVEVTLGSGPGGFPAKDPNFLITILRRAIGQVGSSGACGDSEQFWLHSGLIRRDAWLCNCCFRRAAGMNFACFRRAAGMNLDGSTLFPGAGESRPRNPDTTMDFPSTFVFVVLSLDSSSACLDGLETSVGRPVVASWTNT